MPPRAMRSPERHNLMKKAAFAAFFMGIKMLFIIIYISPRYA